MVRGLLKCELGHGMEPRRGWKLAWYEPRRRVGIFLPAPLHLMARAIRELKWRLAVAWRAPTRERQDVFDLQRVHREEQKLAAEFARLSARMAGVHRRVGGRGGNRLARGLAALRCSSQ